MPILLGGAASPVGWSVQFVEATPERVLDAIQGVHERCEVKGVGEFPDSLSHLTPFEAPWTRELLMPAGRWTAYLNNGVDGGDSTAIAPAVARGLKVRCVVATHAPSYGPGHAATQLEVMGPGGAPPLMYERTVSAHATDGRWAWHDNGEPFEFEDTARYTKRRVSDRFTRDMLLDYLEAMGIPARQESFGQGLLVQQVVRWKRRTVSLEEHRAELATY